MRLAHDRMVAVPIDALLSCKFFQAVDAYQPFDENLHQLYEEPEFLHRDDQRIVFFAEMAFHELSGLPFDQFPLGCVGPAFRFRAFGGDFLELHAAVGPEHRHRLFLPPFVTTARGACAVGFSSAHFKMRCTIRSGITPDRRREMRVFPHGEREVSQRVGGVASLLERPQHQVGKNALFGLTRYFFGEALVMLRDYVNFFSRRQRHSHGPQSTPPFASCSRGGLHLPMLHRDPPLRQILDAQRIAERLCQFFEFEYFLWIGLLVNAVQRRDSALLEVLRNGLVRREHELLDDPMGDIAHAADHALHPALLVKLDDRLGQIEIDRPALAAPPVE